MSRLILTDKKLVRLKNAKSKTRCDMLDALMPNLSVRVTDTGSKAFIFRIRYPGKLFPSRRVLGKVGAMTVAQARDEARKWHELLKGIDPEWQDEQNRLAALRPQQHTFLSVADRRGLVGAALQKPASAGALPTGRRVCFHVRFFGRFRG